MKKSPQQQRLQNEISWNLEESSLSKGEITFLRWSRWNRAPALQLRVSDSYRSKSFLVHQNRHPNGETGDQRGPRYNTASHYLEQCKQANCVPVDGPHRPHRWLALIPHPSLSLQTATAQAVLVWEERKVPTPSQSLLHGGDSAPCSSKQPIFQLSLHSKTKNKLTELAPKQIAPFLKESLLVPV